MRMFGNPLVFWTFDKRPPAVSKRGEWEKKGERELYVVARLRRATTYSLPLFPSSSLFHASGLCQKSNCIGP